MLNYSFTYKGLAFTAQAEKDNRTVHSAWIGPPPENILDIDEDWTVEDSEEVFESFGTVDEDEIREALENEWHDVELAAWEEFEKNREDPY